MRVGRRGFALALAVSTTAVACGGGSDDTTGAAGAEAAERGRRLVQTRGCISCHGAGGRSSVGPSWDGLFGSRVELEDGRTVTADEAYLTRAIGDPDAETVKGYPPQVMARSIPGRPLTDAQIADLVAYLRTLADQPIPQRPPS